MVYKVFFFAIAHGYSEDVFGDDFVIVVCDRNEVWVCEAWAVIFEDAGFGADVAFEVYVYFNHHVVKLKVTAILRASDIDAGDFIVCAGFGDVCKLVHLFQVVHDFDLRAGDRASWTL